MRLSTEVTFGRGDLSVCPLAGITQTAPCRAIRDNDISVNSTLPPSYTNPVVHQGLLLRPWLS